MAKLEPCPNCNKSISTEASVCPKCGQPLDAQLWAAAREKRQRESKGCLIVGAVVVGLLLLIIAFNQPRQSTEDASALEKMSAVFIGHPSVADIQTHMDGVALQLSQNPSEGLYNTWGSILVRLRQSSGVAEIDALRCIEAMNGPAATVIVAFPEAAALCVTMLK